MATESAVHASAKAKLKRWIVELYPGATVRSEFPLAFRRSGMVEWFNEERFAKRTPGVRELRNKGMIVDYRLDLVAIMNKKILVAFEVEKMAPVCQSKRDFLSSMPFETVEIDAAWICLQRNRPESWADGVIDSYGGSIP